MVLHKLAKIILNAISILDYHKGCEIMDLEHGHMT